MVEQLYNRAGHWHPGDAPPYIIAAATLAQWNCSNTMLSSSQCDLLNCSLVTVNMNDEDCSIEDSWDEGNSLDSFDDELEEDKSYKDSTFLDEKFKTNAEGKGGDLANLMASSSCDANGVYIILQVDSEDFDDTTYRYSSSGEALQGDGRL